MDLLPFIAGAIVGALSTGGVLLYLSTSRIMQPGYNEEPIRSMKEGEARRKIERRAAFINSLLRVFAAIGGAIGISLLLSRLKDYLPLTHVGSFEFLISSAFAADGKVEITPLIPYVAVGVLGLMGGSFLLALGATLTLKDAPENQARIRAADNIVKTFGGFFTGLATTLLR